MWVRSVPKTIPTAGDLAIKVLIAERHQGVRDALCATLNHGGVQVVAIAADGFEAIEKARVFAPDVVILDFQMPGCGGLNAARVIRSEMPHIKIILLTIGDDEAYSRAATECGAIASFPKDVATRDLMSAVVDGRRREKVDAR
jgi:two-component system nitrate/nitrite response regulator NarL